MTKATDVAPGSPSPDAGRRFSGAAERNRGPILAVLRRHLPATGSVLEIASGSGQHIVHFAAALPDLVWQPSDPDPVSRRSISAWVEQSGAANIRPPIELDVRRQPWPLTTADAVLAINMVHIAPWEATVALFKGASGITAAGAVLYLYGPYRRRGIPTAPSNEAFDAQLRAQDAAWGLRELQAVVEVAGRVGFEQIEVVEMPANNLSVVFRRIG